jgi:hypothetical protein
MRYLSGVLFFFLISTIGSAQERGIIDCQDRTSVSAQETPGGLMDVKQLYCGQEVAIIRLENGFAKIKINENVFGYVDAKYIRLLGTQNNTDRRVAALEAQVEALKHQSMPISTPAPAKPERRLVQSELPETDMPTRFDIAGMFTWIRSFEDKSDYFGWNASFGGNITKHFGLEVNGSGNYWNSPVSFVGSSYHGLAGGPKFSFPAGRMTPYIHFLVGFTYGRGSAFGYTASANFLTFMPGFGMDVNLNRHFAIRAFQADYPVLRGSGAWSYENLRIGGGFVTRF